jgi:peroxiredoxin
LGVLADNLDGIKAHGVQVVPVLAQRADAVRRYIEETGLPFDILVDERRDTVRAYGVWHRIGLDAWNIARPGWFLIEPGGTISWSFIGDNQKEHPEVPALLEALAARPGTNQS